MRVTGIGHAGMRIDTEFGSVLCDPWVNPAYFGSWFPFPDNSELDWAALGDVDYLYVSHLHRDHYDPRNLRRFVNKRATVLLPDYPTSELRDALFDCGFRSFVETRDGEPVDVDGLRVTIVSLRAPADGPIGDSALVISDGTTRLVNMNDARPIDLTPMTGDGPVDLHLLQFSGAIWYPMVYDLPQRAKDEFARRKRTRQMDRALRYVTEVGAKFVAPIAGPPCFLDDELFGFNDFDGDETNIFPDQTVFLDFMKERGHDGGVLLLPGTELSLTGGGPECEAKVEHPMTDAEVAAMFTDKRAYLESYRARKQAVLAAEHAVWRPARRTDLLHELKDWFEPLMATANRICDGVGSCVLLDLRTQSGEPDERIVLDFVAREVRAYADERCRYSFTIERGLVEALVRDHEIDWVNSLYLSMRFAATRVGQYNEFVYTFFKCLSAERIQYADGWYDEQDHGGEDVRLGDWWVQRRCPHMKADLTQFGTIDGTTLTCQMHGWQFDLSTGRCLTSAGHPLRVRACDPADGESGEGR